MPGTDHREERLRRAAQRAVAQLPGLVSGQRRVLERFLVASRQGWRTHLHERFPETPAGRADALLIGPLGVLVVALREQEPDLDEARAMLRRAAEPFIGHRVASGTVSEPVARLVVVLPAGAQPGTDSIGHHLTITESTLDRVLVRGERRLTKRDVDALCARLAERGAEHSPLEPAESEQQPASGGELFDLEQLSRDRFDEALEGPFESWLTFLDDSQFAMVRRDYRGPARISGPAGTGKSVVALHRLVHLARRTTGPLLFTTYARNLPPIQQRLFRKLAPEVAGRAEFTTVHKWAARLLRDRGRDVHVDATAAKNAFSRAWSKYGRHTKLARLNPDYQYWRDEVDRVIKGRGLAALAEYQRLQRVGRGLRVERGADRELVWRLYETYEELLREKGVHDFNDQLAAALEELRERPLDPAPAAVVVDEVQDVTLIGLRLLREIAGDGPNRLLLVGDGQQQIYAGGWRISDAGIPIRGRGEVLRTNYRNASRILDWAKRFDASNQVDDLDGAAGVSLRDSVATLRGGQVVPWRGPRAEHETALVEAVRALGDVPPDDVAVLTFGKADTGRWRRALRTAGFEVTDLAEHDGERDGKIKVGTVFRAKGLEFRAVLVPELPEAAGAAERGADRREREERARLVALTRARDVLWIGHPEPDGGEIPTVNR